MYPEREAEQANPGQGAEREEQASLGREAEREEQASPGQEAERVEAAAVSGSTWSAPETASG